MSAWIVSKTHIDALVQAGIEAEMIQPEKADEFGLMLWVENHRSIEARYGQPVPDLEYSYEPLEGSSRNAPGVVNSTAACYDYQTCEHDGYGASKAAMFVKALHELTKDRSSDPGPWGTDSRDAFLASV